jgi:hypothetical protein
VQTFLSLLPSHMLFFSTFQPSSHHSLYLVQGDDIGSKQLITIVHDCLYEKTMFLTTTFIVVSFFLFKFPHLRLCACCCHLVLDEKISHLIQP